MLLSLNDQGDATGSLNDVRMSQTHREHVPDREAAAVLPAAQ